MNFETQLEQDRQTALAKGITFDVVTKEARGMPWKEEATALVDLKDAFILTTHLDAWEIGIFVVRGGLGFKYWSSLECELLNSFVLTIEINVGKTSENQ